MSSMFNSVVSYSITYFTRIKKKKKLLKAAMVGYTAARRCLKDARDSSLLLRSLITTMRPPSRIKEERPRSWAKRIAQTTAIASTLTYMGGRGAFFKRDAWTNLWLSQTSTPKPTSFKALNIALSKLTLNKGAGEGTYRVWLGDWAEACGRNTNKIYKIWVAKGIIWDIG